jgi:hypothetical protein
MKYNTNRSLLSSIFPKNPYTTTGLGGNSITSPIEAYISRIKVNFGKISQNDANFAARVRLLTAQKTQKAAASRNSCGFTLCN